MRIRKNLKAGFTLIELMIVVAIVGVLAVLAVYGVRKYIANAKTAEAKNALGQIGKDASAALEHENMDPAVLDVGKKATISRHLCISASKPVPATLTDIGGKKYQPDTTPGKDYSLDKATAGKGFYCMHFEMATPQYYQYNYSSDGAASAVGTTMVATALGDLNGDAKYSTFTLQGAMSSATGNQLRLAPTIGEVDPEE